MRLLSPTRLSPNQTALNLRRIGTATDAVVERRQGSISSTLSCFDRVVITSTLPDNCHPRETLIYSAFPAVQGSTAIFDHPSG
jgi:hypothetical protein